jgi:hypothetical protein
MRYGPVGIAVAAAVAGCLLGAASVSARTPDDLKTLVMTAEEAGPGFTIADSEAITTPVLGYRRRIEHQAMPSTIAEIRLLDDPTLTAAETMDQFLPMLLESGSQLRLQAGNRYTPSGYPDGSLAVDITGTVPTGQLAGAVFVWRQGDVVAVVNVLTRPLVTEPAAVTAAVRRIPDSQRDKLAAALPAAGSPPAP